MSMQNIYDNQKFFQQYKQLVDDNKGFNAIIERPAMYGLTRNLESMRLLDIGCGFGDFCRYARAEGAKELVAVDPSKNMLNEAKKRTQDAHIHYHCKPIETFQPSCEFDMVISSLAFHYVEDFSALVEKINHWLIAGGQFIFSVEHPICTASPQGLLGSHQKASFHPIYNYREERVFDQKWFVNGVKKYHRTISTYLNDLLSQGFCIDKVLEPMPTDKQIMNYPHLARHKIRPPVLIISASKQKS